MTSVRKAQSLAVILSLLLSGAPAALAQQNGAIAGVAPSGAAGGSVVVKDVAGNVVVSQPLSANGSFTFASLAPGSYTVEVLNAQASVVAKTKTVTVLSGQTQSVFGASAAAGGGGLGTTGWVLIGAAGIGLATTAIVVATNDDEPASPSR